MRETTPQISNESNAMAGISMTTRPSDSRCSGRAFLLSHSMPSSTAQPTGASARGLQDQSVKPPSGHSMGDHGSLPDVPADTHLGPRGDLDLARQRHVHRHGVTRACQSYLRKDAGPVK